MFLGDTKNKNASKSPNVESETCMFVPGKLFRRHISDTASPLKRRFCFHLKRVLSFVVFNFACQPEIAYFYMQVFCNENVFRFQVSMNQTFFMHNPDSLQNFNQHLQFLASRSLLYCKSLFQIHRTLFHNHSENFIET